MTSKLLKYLRAIFSKVCRHEWDNSYWVHAFYEKLRTRRGYRLVLFNEYTCRKCAQTKTVKANSKANEAIQKELT